MSIIGDDAWSCATRSHALAGHANAGCSISFIIIHNTIGVVLWPCATSQIVSRLVKYQLEFIISVSIARLIIKLSHDFALQHP
jgi:hypothetical protein